MQELVASNPEPRNWRANIISVMIKYCAVIGWSFWILISDWLSTVQVMVILFVLVLVSLSVVYMTPTDPGPRVSGHKITLEDVIGNKFKPNPRNATWSKGGTQADM